MRSTPAYFRPSARGARQGTFYRTKRRDYVLPFLAAGLVLLGSFRMVSFSDLSVAENVGKFQISFGFMALGYVLSWHFSRKLMWLLLLVAAVARIAALPIAPGDDFERRLWDSRLLSAERNPYELAPDSPELEAYRGPGWEALLDKDRVTRALPGVLWSYHAAWEFGQPGNWVKPFLVAVDLLLCLVFALRFGADRAALYAWNPLVIYAVGGLGVDASLYLLPLVAGYLMWDYWIDGKGGISVIKASGGIGSAMGQMVCVSALLIGIASALNILALPVLLWIVWHVLRRSGLQAGFVALIFGLAPLVLSLMWASISLGVDLGKVLPPEFGVAERGLALVPSIANFFVEGAGANGGFFLVLLVMGTLWMIHQCETLERFASFFVIWMLMLATALQPWSFLLLALVGVGSGNYVFRVASLSAFAYFGAYRILGDTGAWQMPWTLQALIWLPFLVAAAYYASQSRVRQGFYVHSF